MLCLFQRPTGPALTLGAAPQRFVTRGSLQVPVKLMSMLRWGGNFVLKTHDPVGLSSSYIIHLYGKDASDSWFHRTVPPVLTYYTKDHHHCFFSRRSYERRPGDAFVAGSCSRFSAFSERERERKSDCRKIKQRGNFLRSIDSSTSTQNVRNYQERLALEY